MIDECEHEWTTKKDQLPSRDYIQGSVLDLRLIVSPTELVRDTRVGSSQFNGARKRMTRKCPLEKFTSLVEVMSMSRIEWGPSRSVKPVESVIY
jgi:phosphate uptake regulator